MNGYDDSDSPGSDVIERARRKVKTPSFFLIASGALGLVLAVGYLFIAAYAKTYIKNQRDMVNQTPALNAAQKQQYIDALDQMEPVAAPYYLAISVVCAVASLVVIVGGVKLKNLSSKGWALTGSIVAMIPCCINYCCVLGLPVGIWALVAMSNPDVKAAFARNRRPTRGDDSESYPPPV